MTVDSKAIFPEPISSGTFRKIVTEVADGIIGIDLSGCIRYANPAAEQIFGWEHLGLVGKPLNVLLPEQVSHIHDGLVHAFQSGQVDTRRMGQRGIGIVGRRSDGNEINLGITILKTDTDGEPLLIAVIRDITEHVLQRSELKRLADTDHLTGLLNRRAFFDHANNILHGQNVALILLDLDHFKQINDRYGHQVGDQVIRTFSDILRRFSEGPDIAARLGGEEFVLLLTDASVDKAIAVAEAVRVRTTNQSTSQFLPSPIAITVSAGVSAVLNKDISTAIKRADDALYEAKRNGRDRVVAAAA